MTNDEWRTIMKKKLIIPMVLCMVFGFTCAAQKKEHVKNNKISEIIFWSSNTDLNLELLNSTMLSELLQKYDVHTILDLHLFSSYNKESHSLYLYTHSDEINYSDDEIIFNPEYNFQRSYRSIFEKIAYQNTFFSIVINGKIVMNGLNRIYHYSPIEFEYDDADIPKIYYERDNSFRICYKFWLPFKYYTEEDKIKEKVLYIKELDDYFNE